MFIQRIVREPFTTLHIIAIILLLGSALYYLSFTEQVGNPGVAASVQQMNSLTMDLAGNSYVTGNRISDQAGAAIVTEKYNDQGYLQWTAIFRSPINADYIDGSDITLDTQGNIYIAGISKHRTQPLHTSAVIIKYSHNGTQLWHKLLNHQRNPLTQSITPVKMRTKDTEVHLEIEITENDTTERLQIIYDAEGQELDRVIVPRGNGHQAAPQLTSTDATFI